MESEIRVSYGSTIRIYIPEARKALAEASIALAKAKSLAGGWTIRYCAGGWIDPTGKTIAEPVQEYEFLVPVDKEQPVRAYLIALADDLLASGEQAVLITVIHSTGTTITYTLTPARKTP